MQQQEINFLLTLSLRPLYLLKMKNIADEDSASNPMKHRTKEMGNFPLPGSFRNSQPKSNGARIKVILSANLVAAIKANGKCQHSPLLAPDPFWVKAETNILRDDWHWCRDNFHVTALHFGHFVLAGEIVAVFSIRLKAFRGGIFQASPLNFPSS